MPYQFWLLTWVIVNTNHSEYKHTLKYLKFIDAQQRLGLANFIGTHPDKQ
jgi:hypothetical protein